jgi:hypothetical protein
LFYLILIGINQPPRVILRPKGGFFMQRFRRIGLPAALTAALLVTGCGSGNKTGAYSYHRDGRLGTTNANPNSPVNPGYHNNNADTKAMRVALMRVHGVQDATILLNGGHAFVSLRLPSDVTSRDAQRIRSAAENELRAQMPRYDVRVTVGSPKFR